MKLQDREKERLRASVSRLIMIVCIFAWFFCLIFGSRVRTHSLVCLRSHEYTFVLIQRATLCQPRAGFFIFCCFVLEENKGIKLLDREKGGGKVKRGQLEGVRDGDHQFAVAGVAEASAVACVYVVAC